MVDGDLGGSEGVGTAGSTGATWQIDAVDRLEARGADRATALTSMLEHYVRAMHTNEPVHTWSLP